MTTDQAPRATLLSSVAEAGALEVVRDGAFSALGFASHDRPCLLVFASDAAWVEHVARRANVAAVITRRQYGASLAAVPALALCDDPRLAFYRVHEHLARSTGFYGTAALSEVDPSADVAPSASMPRHGVRIGPGVIIEPNVILSGRVLVDDGAVIRAGCVIGSDGFQVMRLDNGQVFRVPHAGGVRIGRNVEIRANGCVDRGLFGDDTTIGDDCTLDHHAYIAHDVQLGQGVLMGAGAVVNGSTLVGEQAWIGPNATIANGMRIGPRARVLLGSVVTRDVEADAQVSGNFAVDHERFIAWMRTIR